VVVIPKNLAEGYKNGNKLTQSTMLRQILMDQMKRKANGEEEYTNIGSGDVPQAAYGLYNDDELYGPGPGPFTPFIPGVGFRQAASSAANPTGFGPGQPGAPTPAPPYSVSANLAAKVGKVPSYGYTPGTTMQQRIQARLNANPNAIGYNPNLNTAGNVMANTPVTPGKISPFLQGEMAAADSGGVDERTDGYDPSALGIIQGLQFIPAGLQLLESFKGNPDLRMHTNAGFNEARTLASQMPTDVNYDAAKRQVGVSENLRNRALSNFRRPDIAGDMAVGHGDALNRIGEIEMGEYNQEEQLKMGKLKALGDIAVGQGADFQKAQAELDLAREQDAAARRTMRHSAVSESVSRVAKNYMDMEKIKAGNLMTDIYEANPYLRGIVKDKPGAVQHMVDQLTDQFPGITPEEITSMMTETSTTVNPMTGMPKSRTFKNRTYSKPIKRNNKR